MNELRHVRHLDPPRLWFSRLNATLGTILALVSMFVPEITAWQRALCVVAAAAWWRLALRGIYVEGDDVAVVRFWRTNRFRLQDILQVEARRSNVVITSADGAVHESAFGTGRYTSRRHAV